MKTLYTKDRISFVEASLKERWEKIYQYNNLSIYDSCHVIERLKDRHKKISYKQFLDYLKKGLEKIDKEYNLEFDKYMIISRSTNLKIQLEIRPDVYTNKPVGVIATILDSKKNPFNKYGEIEVYIEKIIKEKNIDLDSISWLKEASKSIGYFTIEEGDFFQYHFYNGEMSTSFEIIEVDD